MSVLRGLAAGWKVRSLCALLALTIFGAWDVEAQAPALEGCEPYRVAVEGTEEVVAYELLSDWREAVPCLLDIIDQTTSRVQSTLIDPNDVRILTKATGALNIIVADFGREDGAIRHIRSKDSLDTISVLAFAARAQGADNKNLRSNATVLLANIIDNNTICVPIDHLYDSTQVGDDWIRGRSNLLSVVSVIAPWAYKENYEEIMKLVEFTRTAITDPTDLEKTLAVLDRIESRLALQDTYGDPNRDKALPIALQDCARYVFRWKK